MFPISSSESFRLIAAETVISLFSWAARRAGEIPVAAAKTKTRRPATMSLLRFNSQRSLTGILSIHQIPRTNAKVYCCGGVVEGASFGAGAGVVCGAGVPVAGEMDDGAGSLGAEGSGGNICFNCGYSVSMPRRVVI